MAQLREMPHKLYLVIGEYQYSTATKINREVSLFTKEGQARGQKTRLLNEYTNRWGNDHRVTFSVLMYYVEPDWQPHADTADAAYEKLLKELG